MTATVLHESVLLMKHTPSDIGRITDALFMADDRTLKEIPRQAYHHYFDEVGIAMLNWMGRGQTDAIQTALESLTHSVFSEPEMKRLPDLTIKQRIGLQLRVMCAQMTLYQKVQTTTSYSALLLGPRNEVRRAMLQVLYEAFEPYGGLDHGALDYQTVWDRVRSYLPADRDTTEKNVHYHLRKLIEKGLALEDRSAGVRYRLSERGMAEARFHFKEQLETKPAELPVTPMNPPVVAKEETKPVSKSPISELTQQLEQEVGAVLILIINKRDYSMAEISRLIESNGTRIIFSYFTRQKNERSDQYQVTLKLDQEDATTAINKLEGFGYHIESVISNSPALEMSVEEAQEVTHSDMSMEKAW